MKAAIKEIINHQPFNSVLSNIKKNILLNDFLLIHEINTKQILATHGVTIPELRQLLFFHPRYMQQILDNDPLGVNEAPLKIIIREIERDKTSVSFPDPDVNFADYNLSSTMVKELSAKIHSIVK